MTKEQLKQDIINNTGLSSAQVDVLIARVEEQIYMECINAIHEDIDKEYQKILEEDYAQAQELELPF